MGTAFESIKQGLSEAITHARGSKAAVKVYQPAQVDVADLRLRLGLTQEQFAARLGFPWLRCATGSAATEPRKAHHWFC